MSDEIKTRLGQYVTQERYLLDQLHMLKAQQTDIRVGLVKAILTEGGAAIAGRIGRKLTRTHLDQKQKRQFSNQEKNMGNQHTNLVRGIRDLFSAVSVKRRNLKEPNSSKLTAKIDRAQEYVKVETQIRRTIIAIESIVKKQLIYNKDILAQKRQKEVIVPPGKPFTGSKELERILRSTQGYVKIIDPYVDKTTLDLLLSVPEGIPIKLLTAQTGGKEKERRFKRACGRFKLERPQFEIRKSEPGLIHDRFVLTQAQAWNIGSSLKDFGKKLSIINSISLETKSEVEKRFEKIWKKSKQTSS